MFLDIQLELKTVLFVIIDTTLVFLITLLWFNVIDKPKKIENDIPEQCKAYVRNGRTPLQKSFGLTLLYTCIFIIYYYVYDFVFKYRHF